MDNFDIFWNGVTISVRHKSNWLGTGFDHLEIISVNPESAPLPITATGYRSHFLHPGELEPYGNAKAFVLAWLDAMAEGDEWRAHLEQSRQLSLF